MVTKYLIFIFYIFFMFMYFFSIKYTRIRKYLYSTTMILIFLLLSFQDGYGTDYVNYSNYFLSNAENFPTYKGVIFSYSIKAINYFTDNKLIFFIFWSFLQVYFLHRMIKICNNFYIFYDKLEILLYVLISSQFFIMMFNALRSVFVTILIPIAFVLYYEKNKIKSMFVAIIAFLFHPVAIVFFPLFLIFNLFKKHYSIYILLFVFVVIFLINRLNIIPDIAFFLYKYTCNLTPYSSYLVSSHMKAYENINFLSILGIYFIVCMNFISFFFYKKERNKKTIFLYNLAYFTSLIRIFSYGIPIFGRIYLIFVIFEFFIPYILFKKLKTKKFLYIGYFVLLAYIFTIIKYILFNNT